MFQKMSLSLVLLAMVAAAVGCGASSPAQNLATATPTAAATSAVSDPILSLPGGTIHASVFTVAVGLAMGTSTASGGCTGAKVATEAQWSAWLPEFLNAAIPASLYSHADPTATGDPKDIATAHSMFVKVCQAYGY